MGKNQDPPPKSRLLPAKSRCPGCDNFVLEGTEHKCPRGRDRDPFENPAVE